MARENSLSAPIGDDEWSRADKSAVGTMNRPLRLLAPMYFIHPAHTRRVGKSYRE